MLKNNRVSWIGVALLTWAALASLFMPAAAHENHGGAEVEEYDVMFLLPPEEWAEVNLGMQRGETLEWDVHTVDGGEVYLDLHSHGVDLEYHARFNSTAEESDVFTAPRSEGYSFLVENKRDHEVLVQIVIDGMFTLKDTVNIEPMGDQAESPAVPMVWMVALGVVAATFVATRRG